MFKNNKRDLIIRPDSMSSLPSIKRLNGLFDHMWSMVDDAWGNLDVMAFDALQPKTSFPKVNVSETKDGYEVEVAVAGFSKENLAIELKDNALYIKGAKQEEISDHSEDRTVLRREISNRSFRRMIPFQREIDASKTDCTFEDGIIKCVIGKKEVVEEDDCSIKIDIR